MESIVQGCIPEFIFDTSGVNVVICTFKKVRYDNGIKGNF